jgi:hypothetical protein
LDILPTEKEPIPSGLPFPLPGYERNRRAEGLDEDELGELLADGQSRVADLADEIGLAGEQLDDLVLAQPQLPQAILQFRRSAQLLDAHGDAGLDPAQRTKLAPGFFPEG